MPLATSDSLALDRLRALCQPLLDAPGFIPGEQAEERYCTDWSRARGQPLAVLRPRNTDDVARLMAALHQLRQPVVMQGGMTGLTGSCVPQPGEVVLSLERLRTIEEIDPVAGTVTVQAGVCLQALQQAVEAQDLFFPVDIGSRGSCQVGGLIANNAGGNRVLRYGMTRQSVLGLEVVLADGTVISRMGKVLKDNAGYDLKHLFIGSEGSLGVITRALLALQPLPLTRQSALVAVHGFDAVTALLAQCRRQLGPRLTSFEVMWRDFFDLSTGLLKKGRPGLNLSGTHFVLVEAMGMNPERDDALFAEALGGFQNAHDDCTIVLAQSLADAQAIWSIREAAGEAANAMAPCVGFDVSLPLARMAAWTTSVHASLRGMGLTQTQTYGHLGDGNLHLLVGGTGESAVKAEVNELVHRSIGALGGSISGEHGIGLSKKAHLHYCRSAAEINMMKLMKTSLDPHGLLNRGRIFDLP
jgi:FAD/FMN-containing dehydrogenase